MALCPNAPNPPATNVEVITLFDTRGDQDDWPGDFSVAGRGTRNFGNGVIKLTGVPPKATVERAFLIYNTYESNNQPAPAVTIKYGKQPALAITGASLIGLCGSTCWFNLPPPSFNPTTYLRNRIYISPDISDYVTGNGNYAVTGLPVDLAQPIGADGDRLPGCLSSQGAVLVILWIWEDDAGPTDPDKRLRGINTYVGGKLLSASPGFGGSPSYNLLFDTVQLFMGAEPTGIYYKGNSHEAAAAGDTQNSVQGDQFAINTMRFVPLNNAFTPKLGSSLSVKQFYVSNVYDTKNSAFASTFNDCIDWFLFIVSGDKTQPKSQFQILNCAATALEGRGQKDDGTTCVANAENVPPTDTYILVFSNFVDDSQTVAGGHCRAVKYTGGTDTPKSNAPGMFPDAPYYIKIDDEIMKVISKCGEPQGNNGPKDANGVAFPDPVVWKVLRGQNGTTAAEHKAGACIYFLGPPKFISDTYAALAARGQARQRPNPGRPRGRQR